MTVEGLLAALEKHEAAAPSTAPEPTSQPAQQPSTPSPETPNQAPPQSPPATPPATPETPPPSSSRAGSGAEIERDIRAAVEAEYRRKEEGWRGQTKKWENAARRAEEALVAREKAIDDDLARLRDAAPNQAGRDYYQAAIDRRAMERDRQAIAAEKEQLGQVREVFQTFQAQTQDRVLRDEAKGILPGYLEQELTARGLPREAAAEIRAVIDLPANQKFIANASLDAVYGWIKEMGDYIDSQIPTIQTKWAQGNRATARQEGDHWRPTGGSGGGGNPAAPKTMNDTSAEGLAAFLQDFQG